MYDREFARFIKIAIETLKEETIYQMVQQSVEYQKEKDLSDLAEERYLELDLTKEQREVCDDLTSILFPRPMLKQYSCCQKLITKRNRKLNFTEENYGLD